MSKWLVLLIALPFLCFVLVMLWACHEKVAQVERRLGWSEAPAMVVKNNQEYFIFRYAFEGESRTSGAITDHAIPSRMAHLYQGRIVERLKQAEQSGEVLICRANPANPNEAVLFNWVFPGVVFVYALLSTVLLVGLVRIVCAILSILDKPPFGRAAVFAVSGVSSAVFFCWLLVRIDRLPPACIYGATVPWWLMLLPVPGILFAAIGAIERYPWKVSTNLTE